MRRLLTLLAVPLFLAGVASADPIGGPYVGLYADSGHSISSVCYTGQPTPFELWVWFLPGPEGIDAVECSIEFPANVTPGARTVNPSIPAVIPGCCSDPLVCSCLFGTCQTDWVWLFHQDCVLTNFFITVIRILPYPGQQQIEAENCSQETKSVDVLTDLYLPFIDGVEGKTWGAIRNLFDTR